MSNILLFALGAPEIIVIAILILLLFGGKKIPELMKGVGKGIRGFKTEIKEPLDETKDEIKNIVK